MPVPGPRTQFGPLPGYNNPDHARSNLFNLYKRPGPLWWPGRSPGTMRLTLRGCLLAAGQIRRFWHQSIDLVPGGMAFSWSTNSPAPGRSQATPDGYHITRALRYMTRSVYERGGNDNTRMTGLHSVIIQRNRHKTITVAAGSKRFQPTVRNRISSFGSRVPTLNQSVSAAENQPGEASQA